MEQHLSPRAPAAAPATDIAELTREECLHLLAAHGFGRLCVNLGDGAPLIRPVNYVFDHASQSVAFRTARGSKFNGVLRSGAAAFEIDGIDEDARTGWSVIVLGLAQEVTSQHHVDRLDSLGLASWAPGEKSHWMRIRAWTVSGRRISAA